MSPRLTGFLLVLALAALGLANCLFTVAQYERAMVLRFGKVQRDGELARIYEPGIHFKWPMAEKVMTLDARIQTMDRDQERVLTAEKKFMMVDAYVKWRIKDFEQFYKSTQGDHRRGEDLLERMVNTGLRSEFGKRTNKQLISDARSTMMDTLKAYANKSAANLGMEVVDVRVKTINYPEEVSGNVYDRMRAERQRVATEHRSKGEKEANIIKAKTDATVRVLIADAERQAATLRGTGDAEATALYAQAFQKNPEFYAFVKSLDAYKVSFKDKTDVLVLKPDSEFFRYMKSSGGK
ncbi:MAG: protease modulator HflC [Gammaproteobacteria bacterium]|nr:protease modulator HflC [Gammaproteobacteria bacterium]